MNRPTLQVPMVPVQRLAGWARHDVVNLLAGAGLRGIELGVAEGVFSQRMVRSGRFDKFFGVDIYADAHNTAEYKRALQRVGLDANYSLLRMSFDEAYDLFPDGYFDFVYVDGYAHGGENGGDTIFDWFSKVKVGGLIAGDDYHADWPLVVWAVNEFARQTGADLLVTDGPQEGDPYCRYPSWAIVKQGPAPAA